MLRIEAMTSRPFNAALFDASDAIGKAGGWINHHQMFSDLMAVVNFEVPATGVGTLVEALTAAEIKITATQGLPTQGAVTGDAEIYGQLTLMFPQAKGDLRREMPAFD